MASEYNLKLKAVLDSSQVQQELNKLKQNANATFNPTEKNGNRGVSLNITNSGTHLTSVLERLNLSLFNLLRAIDKMSYSTNSKNINATKVPNLAAPLNFGGMLNTDAMNQRLKKNFLAYLKFQDAMSKISCTPIESMVIRSRFGMNPSDLPYNLFFGEGRDFSNAKRLANGIFGYRQDYSKLNYARWLNKESGFYDIPPSLRPLYVKDEVEHFENQQKQIAKASKNPYLKHATMFMLGQGVNSIGNVLTASGHYTAGQAVGAVGGIAQSTAMGAFMGGPAGAAVGAAIGALTEGCNLLTSRFTELAKTIEYSKKQIETGKKSDEHWKEYKTSVEDAKRLKTEDIGYFKSRLWEAQRDQTTGRFTIEQIDNEGGLEAFNKKTLKMAEDLGAFDSKAEVEARQKLAEEYVEAREKQKKLDTAVENYANIIKQLEEQAKLNKKAYADSIDTIKKNNEHRTVDDRTDSEITKKKAELKIALDAAVRQRDEFLAKGDITPEGMLKKAELEKNAASLQSEYDFYDSLSKGRKSFGDTMTDKRSSRFLSFLTESFQNNIEGIVNDTTIGNYEEMKGRLKSFQKDSHSFILEKQKEIDALINEVQGSDISPKEREKKLKRISDLEDNISNLKSRMDIATRGIESIKSVKVESLQEALSKLTAPDMSHATSLAQYGYGMGEKNDAEQRLKAQENYLKDQKDIQEQIKQILKEKLPQPGLFT